MLILVLQGPISQSTVFLTRIIQVLATVNVRLLDFQLSFAFDMVNAHKEVYFLSGSLRTF